MRTQHEQAEFELYENVKQILDNMIDVESDVVFTGITVTKCGTITMYLLIADGLGDDFPCELKMEFIKGGQLVINGCVLKALDSKSFEGISYLEVEVYNNLYEWTEHLLDDYCHEVIKEIKKYLDVVNGGNYENK